MSNRMNMLQFTLEDSDEESPRHSGVIPIEGFKFKDHFQAVSVKPSMFAVQRQDEYQYGTLAVKEARREERGQQQYRFRNADIQEWGQEEKLHIKILREMEHDEPLPPEEIKIKQNKQQLDSKNEQTHKEQRQWEESNHQVEDVTPPLFTNRGNLEIALSDSESQQTGNRQGSSSKDGQIQSVDENQRQLQASHPKHKLQMIDIISILEGVTNKQAYLHNMAIQPISQGKYMHLVISRNSSGFNSFWPEFQVFFSEGEHKLLYAKKMMGSTTSNYYITLQPGVQTITHPSFIAKMRSNFSGSLYHVFDNGINPDKANKFNKSRTIQASIKFKSQIQNMEPRSFDVFLLKEGVKYQQLEGFIPLKEVGLDQLYLKPQNKDKMLRFVNRRPVFSEAFKGYILNFGGRVQKPSIKNFILEDVQGEKREVLMMGKKTDDLYRIDVSCPISPYIGLCICLANFDTKFLSD